ncbi:MAG: hypothetical protein U0271_29690 [Polyangiaceae bacterium]
MKKSLTLLVSDYTNESGDSDTTSAPLTYFVAGAPRSDDDEPAAALRGDELVSGTKFKDDLRDPVNPSQSCIVADGAEKTILVSNTATARASISDELLTRGGYRDHTDGNRVSTTRGDSVEVVYGNYKLVVLGRITQGYDPSGSSGLGDANNTTENTTLAQVVLDSSGGHDTDTTSTGGRVVSATWDDGTEDGSWRTLEQTDDGDKRVVFHGRVDRTHFGPKITRRVGKGAPEVSIDGGANQARAHDAARPTIESRTFARSIASKERSRAVVERLSVSKDFEEKTTAHGSFVRADAWDKRGEIIGAAGFRETLAAQKIERKLDADYRFASSVGAVSCSASAIAYSQTLLHGTRLDLWFFGGELTADLAKASLKIGMDSAYRMGPSVDLAQGLRVRAHATVDALVPISWLATRLFNKSQYVFDGDVVVIKVKNASYSNTV